MAAKGPKKMDGSRASDVGGHGSKVVELQKGRCLRYVRVAVHLLHSCAHAGSAG